MQVEDEKGGGIPPGSHFDDVAYHLCPQEAHTGPAENLVGHGHLFNLRFLPNQSNIQLIMYTHGDIRDLR